MRSKIGIAHENVDARRVRPHRGGSAGCGLRTQARDSKADCTCSQSEPANMTKRAINHSTSSAKNIFNASQTLVQRRSFVDGPTKFTAVDSTRCNKINCPSNFSTLYQRLKLSDCAECFAEPQQLLLLTAGDAFQHPYALNSGSTCAASYPARSESSPAAT